MVRQLTFSRTSLSLLLLAAVLWLTGCGVTQAGNWPGMSAQGSRVYVSYANEVSAVDVVNQTEVWSYTGEGGAQFFAPPMVVDDTVYIGDFGSSGGLFSAGLNVSVHAVNADAGTPVWVSGEQLSGRVLAQALVADGRVYLGTSDNHFVALDAQNGQKIWDITVGNAIWDQPFLLDGVLYFTSLDRNVYALDAETGDIIWNTAISGASTGTPVVSEEEGLLYIGSFDGEMVALELDTGDQAWVVSADDWVWAAPLLHEGVVYYTDLSGKVYGVDAADGTAVLETPIQMPAGIEAQPIIFGGDLILAAADTEDSVGYLARYTIAGEQVWQIATEATLNTTPVIVDGSIVVAMVGEEEGSQEIVKYNPDNGTVQWRHDLAEE